MKCFHVNLLFSLVFSSLSFCLQAQTYEDNNRYDEYSNGSSNYNNPIVGVSEKVVSNMEELKNTRFMQQYVAMQIEIEETIKMVKANEHLYNPEDMYQIKIAYRITATEFNRVLDELKRDLLRGKYKAKNSAYFNRDLEQKHFHLTQFYLSNFKEPIDAIMQGGVVVVE